MMICNLGERKWSTIFEENKVSQIFLVGHTSYGVNYIKNYEIE